MEHLKDIDSAVKEVIDNWILINYRSSDHFKSSRLMLHHMIQFIAITGRYLNLKNYNEGHQLMEWLPGKCMFCGKWIDAKKYPLKISLKIPEFQLLIHAPPFRILDYIDLQGRTKPEIYEWLIRRLSFNGVDTRNMHMEMPYQIPHHPTDEGASFKVKSFNELREICGILSNASRVLNYFGSHFKNSVRVGISAENFCTQVHIPLGSSEAVYPKSFLNIGLAVPDSYIDHYYFYVNHWPVANTIGYYISVKTLQGGGYWADLDKLNAVLPLNSFFRDSDCNNQIERVLSFFSSALNNSFELLNYAQEGIRKGF